MEFFGVDSVSSHSHALALFALYLFVHFYMAAGSKSDESPRFGSTTSRLCRRTHGYSATAFAKSLGIAVAAPPSKLHYGPSQLTQSDDDDTATVASSIEDELPVDCTSLEEACPDSTPAERQRFLVACKGNKGTTQQRLQNYLCWRQHHERIRTEHNIRIKPSIDPDYDLWVESCLVAMRACGEVADNIVLPRVVRCYSRHRLGESPGETRSASCEGKSSVADRNGFTIFHMIPGLMDDKLAKTTTYTLAVAIYFDRKFDRESFDTVTVCLDVRAGKGWPNIHGLRLIPFMKNSLTLLLPLFPERLHKCVVYPVPFAFLYVWTMISKCLDPVTREKICVLSGKCTIESPPPMEKLIAHLGEEPAKLLEDTRIASFKA